MLLPLTQIGKVHLVKSCAIHYSINITKSQHKMKKYDIIGNGVLKTGTLKGGCDD